MPSITYGGMMITLAELKAYFEGSGFGNIRVIDQPNPGRFVMVGEKSG